MNGQSILKTLLINRCTNTIHNIIQFEPNKATLASHFLWGAWHLPNAAVKNREHPSIVPNGMVRVNITPKSGITKGHHPTYYLIKHKAITINGNGFNN